MTEHQWQIVVRTFWAIVLVGLVVGVVALLAKAQNDSERKAREHVCEIEAEFGFQGEDC